jgi:chromosome segregation ATPase
VCCSAEQFVLQLSYLGVASNTMRPQSLDAATAAKNIERSHAERTMKLAEVEKEMARVRARMEKKMSWSRQEEIRQEQEAALAAQEVRRQREAEQQEALHRQQLAAKQQRKQHEATLQAKRAQRERAEERAMWAARDQALAEKLGRLSQEVEAAKSASSSKSNSPESKKAASPSLLEASAGLVEGLLHKLLGHDDAPAAQLTAQERELEDLKRQYQAAERKVQEMRTTGGQPLASALAEVKELQPRLRHMQVERERRDRASDPQGAARRAPMVGSPASIRSARRLDRQRHRMEARGGGTAF